MQKNGIKLSVLTDNNNMFSEYNKDGKIFIEGRKNSSYKIKIENLTYSKKLAIVSIDSLSVIDGKKATENSTGYILPSFGSVVIDGWRISNDKVKKFEFSSLKNSYSSKTDQGISNCGVIGVLVFNEITKPKIKYHITPVPVYLNNWYYPMYKNSWDSYGGQGIAGQGGHGGQGNSSIYQCSVTTSCQPEFNLGTQMGKEQISKVTNDYFEKESNPNALLELFYVTRKQLEKMGIFPTKHIEMITPSSFESNGFCKVV